MDFLDSRLRGNDRVKTAARTVSRGADAGWKPALPGFLHTLFRANDERRIGLREVSTPAPARRCRPQGKVSGSHSHFETASKEVKK